jgi:predicted nucleic acid-binding Zn ribbon protein
MRDNYNTQRDPQRLGRALDRLMGTLRAPSVDVLDTIFTRWAEIVGEDVAAHCRPLSIDGNTLIIAAEDSTWASELRWLEKDVLARVAEVSKSDGITTVNVRVARRK